MSALLLIDLGIPFLKCRVGCAAPPQDRIDLATHEEGDTDQVQPQNQDDHGCEIAVCGAQSHTDVTYQLTLIAHVTL